jgi:cytochrome P450
LKKRKSDKGEHNDLLQRIIDAKDEDGNHLPDEVIVSEMMAQM